MDYALSIGGGSRGTHFFQLRPSQAYKSSTNLHFPTSNRRSSFTLNAAAASSSNNSNASPKYKYNNSITDKLKIAARNIVFFATAASLIGHFPQFPAWAQTLTQQQQEIDTTTTAQEPEEEEQIERKTQEVEGKDDSSRESNSEESIDALKALLEKKLESQEEDTDILGIVTKLVSAEPDQNKWKFLMAKLLTEMDQTQQARDILEGILSRSPFLFEALFDNAMVMERCGDGPAVIARLEEALKVAVEENKANEARNVRLIIAQIQFLQKNVEEALRSYDELSREDPDDFRPYFCKGMIYSLLDNHAEATKHFAKYRQLSPSKSEVEGYLRKPLSTMKPADGTNEENQTESN